MNRVLVIEDDKKLNQIVSEEMREIGLDVKSCLDPYQAIELIQTWSPEVVITDLIMPGIKGDELTLKIKNANNPPDVIVVTAFGSIDSAIKCLKSGADDFITKPIDFDHLGSRVNRLLQHRKDKKEAYLLRRAIGSRGFHGMIGQSKEMQKLFNEITQIAESNASVLIHGESGTGKELVAQALHKESPRRDKPFVIVNCASIPRELMESEFFGHQKGAFTGANNQHKGHFIKADGGTLFLDEIAEMPFELQAKLLRVLQEKKVRVVGTSEEVDVDVRVIAATNRNLEEDVNNRRFRQDLFYRLENFSLYLPPLRDRHDDLNLLIYHYFDFHKNELSKDSPEEISEEAMDALCRYDYPGNIRELSNIMRRSITFSSQKKLEVDSLPKRLFKKNIFESQANFDEKQTKDLFKIEHDHIITLEELERLYIEFALQHCGNNKRRVAALLGIGRRTLYRRMGQTKKGSS